MDEIYEESEKTFEIPEKCHRVVKEIAQWIDSGMICFLNPRTLELEYATEDELMTFDDPDEFEIVTGEKFEDTFRHGIWDECITVEKPASHDSFKIMESFVDDIDNHKLQSRLVYALNNRKPFANFKRLIEDSDYREDWFKYKKDWLERYVWEDISYEIEKLKT